MTIGIVTGFSNVRSAGLEQSLLMMLEGLEKERPRGVEYVIYTSRDSHIEAGLKERGLTGFKVVKLGFGSLWKQFGLFAAPRADIYLFNGPLVPLFFAPRRSFVLVYDFAYKLGEAQASFKKRLTIKAMDAITALAMRRAERVIAISEATKADIIRLFHTSAEKIAVVYPGVKDLSSMTESPTAIPEQGYFLFVGTMKERKNPLNLILGYIEAVKEHALKEQLLLVGRNDPSSPYGKRIADTIREAGMEERIRFLGRMSDGELKYLYTHAVVFAFPSAFEGFGMPVVEAMKLGVPVLTSTATSLPEAAGNAALLVAPEDVHGIAQALLRLAQEPTLRADLVRRGTEQAKRFSPEICAREMLAILAPRV